MSGVPWWVWSLVYAAAGAANAAWFMREWARNKTMQDRIDPLFEALSPLFGVRFIRGLMVASAITAWPIWLLVILVTDVPGHGKNIDEPKAGDQ